jgi:ubiquinone/menaquinone biosynthesis C-methylase UbiE
MLKTHDFFDELHLRTDSHVADFGCGVGENAKVLSKLVPNGKIFAIDVHKDLLEHLETDILKEKKKQEKRNVDGKGDLDVEVEYQNIVPVWGDIENLDGSRLRDESIDSILISNTFFLLKHKKACVMEMKRVLKRRGRILFVDWHKSLGKSLLHKESVLHEKDIEELFTQLDMKVFPLIHKDDYHFVLVIEK